MSTGPQHYREAERLLTAASNNSAQAGDLAAAQVHATLALAAATATRAVDAYYGEESKTGRDWAGVV